MNRKILREAAYVTLIAAAMVACSDGEESEELVLDSESAGAEEPPPPTESEGETTDASAETVAAVPQESPSDQLTMPSPSDLASSIPKSAPDAGGNQPGDPGAFAYIMPENTSKFMWVFTDHLIVRAEPSAASAKLGKLRWGKKVGVLTEQDGWVKIGDGAWAGREHLTDRVSRWLGKDGTNTEQKSQELAEGLMPGGGLPFRVSAYVLNVRDQPGKEGKVLRQLSHGMLVRGRETENGWIEIGPGQFVSRNWLSQGAGAVAH